MANRVVPNAAPPTPFTATAIPWGDAVQPPAVKSMSSGRTPGRSGCKSAWLLASRMRTLALLYSRDDPVADVGASPSGGLRIIAICCADPLAPCTNGRFSGWTASEVLLPMQPPKVVGETVVEVFFQVATLVCVPAAGIPPLQLARRHAEFQTVRTQRRIRRGGNAPVATAGSC